MAIDPICGMTVDERTAISAERGGQTFYFCSEHCRQKFVESQDRKFQSDPLVNSIVGERPRLNPQHSSLDSIYTCPMHPEIAQDHPGICPKCGMALEPKTLISRHDDDTELRDMTRRLWWATALALPVRRRRRAIFRRIGGLRPDQTLG